MKKPADEPAQTWRPPTRRAFVAMLGAAAAFAIRGERATAEPVTPPGPTRWIGHC